MGALISASPLGKVLDYVKIGRTEGAQIATGGKQIQQQGFENGYFMEPTILTNCTDSMRVTHEEIFGPVMSVLIFDDEQDAIERADSAEFGLGAGVMTTDLSRAHRMADALISGNVWVNSFYILPPVHLLVGQTLRLWAGKFDLYAGCLKRGQIGSHHAVIKCRSICRDIAKQIFLQLLRLCGGVKITLQPLLCPGHHLPHTVARLAGRQQRRSQRIWIIFRH